MVWDHFYSEGERTFCEICKQDVKTAGNTSNLFKHLQTNHKKEYNELEKEREKQQAEKKRKTLKQMTLKDSFSATEGYGKDSCRKKRIDEALVRMISMDLQPTSIVEDKGFHAFLKVIDPKYIPPSRRTITRDHLPKLYDACKSNVMESLSKAIYCAITTDIWTLRATQGFLTLTCHYIAEGKAASCVLETFCFKENHTGANIATELLRITSQWNLNEKVVCAVTDSASNMSLAIHITRWTHLPCFAHTLNLIVQGAIAYDTELSDLLKQCKNIVSYFHKSVKANDKLATVQEQLHLPKNKLVQEVETRWNSTYYMIQRYIEQHNAITTTLCLMGKNDLCLNNENTDFLIDAVTLLASFEAVTVEISSESFVSVSIVIPMVRSLQKLTNESKSKSMLRCKLIENIAHRFGMVEANATLSAATFLDPRFKKFAFAQVLNANQCEKQLLAEMGSISVQSNPADSTQPATSNPLPEVPSNPETASKSCNVWEFFDAKVAEAQGRQTNQSECLVEIRHICK